MNKKIVVREYEPITENAVFYGNHDVKIGKKNFAEIKNFVEKYNETYYTDQYGGLRSRKSKNGDGDDVFTVFKIGRDGGGDYVKAQKYVGLIQLKNGLKIQILPKVDFSDGEDKDGKKTVSIFVKMLKSLKDFPFKAFNNADLKIYDNDIYEVFITMYLEQVSGLCKRGIKSDYNAIEENTSFYKGKLSFDKQITYNLCHKEKFYVTYDEFTENRAENRLIKTTLLKLLKLSSSSYNLKLAKQVLIYFENVERSVDVDRDFGAVKTDRNMIDYEPIMKWTKVFLKDQSFVSFEGETDSLSLLFPMERLFESFVAERVKRVFGEKEYSVSAQDKGKFLLKENERNIFSLRPDIVVSDGHEKIIVMDTKWKRLSDDKYANYNISQADMYQMYAYAKEYKTDTVYVLYPKTEVSFKNEIVFQNERAGIKIHIFFIEFEYNAKPIDKSIEKLFKEISGTA